MKETKVQFFLRMFYYWCGKLNLKRPIQAIQDNRLDCSACVDNWDNQKKICVRYNAQVLRMKPKHALLSDIFHEIGHILQNLPYDTEDEMIECEFQAEDFSCQMMKKFYPKQYQQYLRWFKKRKKMKEYQQNKTIYYKAFIRIKDYKNI